MRTIKDNIKRRGIKLQDVADGLGISASALTQSLNSDMAISRLIAIAQICECTCDELINGESENKLVCPHCGKPISVTLQ